MEFNMLDIWVQMHNVPLCYMNLDCAKTIGKQIRCVKEVDTRPKGECWEKNCT